VISAVFAAEDQLPPTPSLPGPKPKVTVESTTASLISSVYYNEVLTVYFESSIGDATITLYDVNFNVCATSIVNTKYVSYYNMYLGDYAPGVYILQVTSKKADTYVEYIVIE